MNRSTAAPPRCPRSALVRTLLPVLTVFLLVTACTNTPPPPLVNKSAATSVPRKIDLDTVTVDVSSVQGGYNPHLLGDRSTITSALASLLLPSMFRPGADGTPRMDRTILESAEVTDVEPFTVSYSLRTDASWSDGVPIAAEDFVYLRDQMTSQRGVVDPAGYRLISDVTSAGNGKVVNVTFDEPYPGWRSLFNNLVPAHLLKDAPGGWNAGMQENFPAVAGPFSIKQADQDRGVVSLERNERYWETPAVLSEIVLRTADVESAAGALRSGDSQLASVPSEAAADDLAADVREAKHDVDVWNRLRPEVAQLWLRRQTELLSDSRVRRAVAEAIDRDALISEVLGPDGVQRQRTDAMVLAPSQRDYAPTLPADAPGANRNLADTAKLLRAAGYEREATRWSRDGEPLTLTIAAPAGRAPYVRLARALAEQLQEAGIASTVLTPNPDELFGELLGTSPAAQQQPVDLLLSPRVVDDDPAATLAENFGCPQTPPNAAASAPENPAGFCDPDLQSTIDGALSGRLTLDDALRRLEPRLWRQAVALPLFQVADQVAVSGAVAGVRDAPELFAPYASAPRWKRVKR